MSKNTPLEHELLISIEVPKTLDEQEHSTNVRQAKEELHTQVLQTISSDHSFRISGLFKEGTTTIADLFPLVILTGK